VEERGRHPDGAVPEYGVALSSEVAAFITIASLTKPISNCTHVAVVTLGLGFLTGNCGLEYARDQWRNFHF
jgi:hypothetical protein